MTAGPAAQSGPGLLTLPEPWRALMLVIICLLLYLPGFFTIPPFDRDEARFAQASRQMIASGDLVDIRFQDETRYKKPVGIYWLQATGAQVFGADGTPVNDAIWMYRLPSLVGAILAVLLTAWAGSLLFGRAAGTLGGLFLAACVVLGVEARMAKTDAMLLATIVAAQAVLAHLYLRRDDPRGPGWLVPLAFWAIQGASVLIKGPIGPMVSSLTCLALVIVERRVGWLGRLRPLSGLALLTVIVSPWLIAITIESGGAFFTESIGRDMLAKVTSGQESKGLPPGFYFGTFWITFAPFACLTLLALPWLRRHWKEPPVRFCLAWIVPTWIVFELVPTKLLHYTMPVFPAVALLTAAAVLAYSRDPQREAPSVWMRGAAGIIGAVLAGLLGGAIGAVPVLVEATHSQWAIAAGALIFGSGVIAALLMIRRCLLASVAAALAGLFVFYGLTYGITLPGIRGLWVSRQAAEMVQVHAPCPAPAVASAGYQEPSLVFLLGTETRLAAPDEAAQLLLDDPNCALALVENRENEAFLKAFAAAKSVEAESADGRASEAAGPIVLATAHGFNYAKGRQVFLRLYGMAP